ncbi:hypothetical protein OUO_1367 [Helicobacter pylori R046Wa]|nr:hypothetical protein OUO_1367 [Helicobacter pylori R046Wa]
MTLRYNHSILIKPIKSNPTSTLDFCFYKYSLMLKILINAYKK